MYYITEIIVKQVSIERLHKINNEQSPEGNFLSYFRDISVSPEKPKVIAIKSKNK